MNVFLYAEENMFLNLITTMKYYHLFYKNQLIILIIIMTLVLFIWISLIFMKMVIISFTVIILAKVTAAIIVKNTMINGYMFIILQILIILH